MIQALLTHTSFSQAGLAKGLVPILFATPTRSYATLVERFDAISRATQHQIQMVGLAARRRPSGPGGLAVVTAEKYAGFEGTDISDLQRAEDILRPFTSLQALPLSPTD